LSLPLVHNSNQGLDFFGFKVRDDLSHYLYNVSSFHINRS
jgi:hypothetical protein